MKFGKFREFNLEKIPEITLTMKSRVVWGEPRVISVDWSPVTGELQPIDVGDFDPRKTLASRYAAKEVNPGFYERVVISMPISIIPVKNSLVFNRFKPFFVGQPKSVIPKKSCVFLSTGVYYLEVNYNGSVEYNRL